MGSVLNVSNQGDALPGPGVVNWVKITLTSIVPYCVRSYGAVSFRMKPPAATVD